MQSENLRVEKFAYDNKIVRDFSIAMVVWGIVGFLVGLIIAIKLRWVCITPLGWPVVPEV